MTDQASGRGGDPGGQAVLEMGARAGGGPHRGGGGGGGALGGVCVDAGPVRTVTQLLLK